MTICRVLIEDRVSGSGKEGDGDECRRSWTKIYLLRVLWAIVRSSSIPTIIIFRSVTGLKVPWLASPDLMLHHKRRDSQSSECEFEKVWDDQRR
jgi:hypothetical protein